MTRLTQEQIAEAFNTHRPHWMGPWSLTMGDTKAAMLAFAHRIAALAVQEVERGVDPCYKQESEMAWAALGQDVSRAFNPSELGSEILKLRAALAEVTKERDELVGRWEHSAKVSHETAMRYEALRAQLATAKREGAREALTRLAEHFYAEHDAPVLRVRVQKFRDREYPAIDPDSGSTCKPDCCLPNYCAPGKGCHASEPDVCHKECPDGKCHAGCEYPVTPSGETHRCKPEDKCEVCDILRPATPSPEAREVNIEVEQEADGSLYVRITPADAKRIVRLAQEAPDAAE